MKTNNIKVAIFVLGGAIKFVKKNLKRADGTNEYYKLIKSLCANPQISEVLIIQKSDWGKLDMFEKQDYDPRGVLRYIYDELDPKDIRPSKGEDMQLTLNYQKLHEYLENDETKPDFGLGFIGPGYMTNNVIPNFLNGVRDPNSKVKLLGMTYNYSSPIVHYLNKTNLPWYMICTDPRYTKPMFKAKDTVNYPKEIIAQYNTTSIWHSLKEYKHDAEFEDKTINVRYSGIEKLNLIGEEIISPESERPNKFTIVAMQSVTGQATKDKRFDAIKEWILDRDTNQEVEIYGKWKEHFTNGYPQFKGYVTPAEIDQKFKETRYTLVIPIGPNWVTSKYAEVLMMGVVPFLHPTYDTQENLVPKDHFIRVSSPEDFYAKMKFLDENPDKRIKLINLLQERLIGNVSDGTFVYDIVNKSLENTNIGVRI